MPYIIFAVAISAKNEQDESVKYVPIIYAFLLKPPFRDKPNVVFLLRATETAKWKLITTASTTKNNIAIDLEIIRSCH